jgi:hypothetical protein
MAKSRRNAYRIFNGWKIISVKGDAKDRGFQHGAFFSAELSTLAGLISSQLKRHVFNTNGKPASLESYVELCNKLARPYFDTHECCREWREELDGMVAGALSKGVIITVDLLFAWNMYLGMDAYLDEKSTDHCSAFIATGDATKDGKIVLAHNTHTGFVFSSVSNVVQYVKPDRGNAFVMQTSPGLICSSMDWFVCKSGIVGCETTIADITYTPKFGKPYFCRIRECMQYANNLDDCVAIMKRDNAGDYPGGWMFGDLNTNEIMLLEVAKTVAEPRRTKSGVYYGCNFAHDSFIRDTQTENNLEINDLSTSIGARNHRLDWLLNKEYWGRIDCVVAKQIISDHYDPLTKKLRKSQRGICKHAERAPSGGMATEPFGAIDGKVLDSKMAKRLAFWGRWGSSCGRDFKMTRSQKKGRPYVEDLKGWKWALIKPNKN